MTNKKEERELKFRACIGYYVDGKKDEDARFIEFDLFNVPKEVEGWDIVQYTGLKDKNDKDIYEGDILLNYETKDSKVIVFNGGSFAWGYIPITVLNSYIDEDKLVVHEVVGNIYETPELL